MTPDWPVPFVVFSSPPPMWAVNGGNLEAPLVFGN